MTTISSGDKRLERVISNLLRTGVLLSGLIVLLGGILYMIRHGNNPVAYAQFHAEAEIYWSLRAILKPVVELKSQSIIELGLLLLIATPVARVVFCLIGFALERDRTYVAISAIVLIVLVFSLFVL
jgi:uncharacterized membrane protein